MTRPRSKAVSHEVPQAEVEDELRIPVRTARVEEQPDRHGDGRHGNEIGPADLRPDLVLGVHPRIGQPPEQRAKDPEGASHEGQDAEAPGGVTKQILGQRALRILR